MWLSVRQNHPSSGFSAQEWWGKGPPSIPTSWRLKVHHVTWWSVSVPVMLLCIQGLCVHIVWHRWITAQNTGDEGLKSRWGHDGSSLSGHGAVAGGDAAKPFRPDSGSGQQHPAARYVIAVMHYTNRSPSARGRYLHDKTSYKTISQRLECPTFVSGVYQSFRNLTGIAASDFKTNRTNDVISQYRNSMCVSCH